MRRLVRYEALEGYHFVVYGNDFLKCSQKKQENKKTKEGKCFKWIKSPLVTPEVSENIQAMHILNHYLFTNDTAESPVLEELINSVHIYQ